MFHKNCAYFLYYFVKIFNLIVPYIVQTKLIHNSTRNNKKTNTKKLIKNKNKSRAQHAKNTYKIVILINFYYIYIII